MPLVRSAASLALILLVAGCQSRLNIDRTFKLETGATQTFEIDPPRYEQKTTVTISTDAPVKAFVYFKRDADAVEQDLTRKEKSEKVLGTWSGDKSGTIEVTVPAHQIAIVRLDAMQKPANVAVKIVGK